jgi:membrane associated rhomboid family serine protease
MPRYAPGVTYSFGPGPLTPAVKYLLIANITAFVVQVFVPLVSDYLGLRPSDVIERGWLWQLGTYAFLHVSILHIAFNMLSLWMFGVELERLWGTVFFAKYYAITAIGAAAVTVFVSLLPFGFASSVYDATTMGASGAIYGLLLAYALYYPHRPIYLYFLFQVPAKYFVMIVGGISLLASISSQGGVAHAAHLGGLLVGYLYLKGGRLDFHPIAELKYRYLKWKIGRMRRRFDVHPGGRANDWDGKIH